MNEELLKQYKDLITHQRYTSFRNGDGYVVNVKVGYNMDYDKEVIKKYLYPSLTKNREKDLLDEKIDGLSQGLIDEIFWDTIGVYQDDLKNLYAFNKEEVQNIEHETQFIGNSGGYFGFKYFPDDIIYDYENDGIDDDGLLDQIKEIEQMNNVLDYAENFVASISQNDIVIDYIENNLDWLDEIRTTVELEEKEAKIKEDNKDAIKIYTDQLNQMGLDVKLTLK